MSSDVVLMQQLKGVVAVLYGGNSAEREVSLESGAAVFAALRKAGVPAVLVDTQKEGWWNRFGAEFSHAFIILHGRGGEDGTVQGLLETLGVSYTGSGVMASALALDKLLTKQLWRGIGLPSPEFEVLTAQSDFAALIARWGTVMVKPAREGSSVGMAKVSSVEELRKAFELANRYDAVVLAERCISGPEFTVAMLGGRVLPAIRLETDNVFYDYEAKYISNETRYICPCGLSPEQESELAQLARAAFDSLGCRDWGRVDVMQDGDGKFYLLEVNTIPGMTSHSLVPMAARAAGIEFEQLVVEILRPSLQRAADDEQGAD
jgi:D-alanine-D-alanine ligase